MIISLHTPKAGGSSFKILLKNHFKDTFKEDYDDMPINTPVIERQLRAETFRKNFKTFKRYLLEIKGTGCIHGHFLPYKYSPLIGKKNTVFITWMRDPLERLASHYYYWQRTYDKNISGSLHKIVIEDKWTFEEFCFSTEMKNFYHQFLWQFPIENFSFIGITEHFTADMEYFAEEFLGVKNIKIPKVNINPKPSIYFSDDSLVGKLKEFHNKDYELYFKALEIRNRRIYDQS